MKIETYEEIYGWFDFADLYDDIFWQIPDNGIFIEVGCFLGKSAAYFGGKIKDISRPINFLVIDTFEGTIGEHEGLMNKLYNHNDMYEVFKKNMMDLGLEDIVSVRKETSVEAAKDFPNKLVDGVFLDADHSYEAVKSDIEAWLPKIKDSGFIAGHDIDFPGVWKAVREKFDTFEVKNRCWYVKLNGSK